MTQQDILDFLSTQGLGGAMGGGRPMGFGEQLGSDLANLTGGLNNTIGGAMQANANRISANRMASQPYDSALALEKMRQEGDSARQAQKYAMLAPLLQSLGGYGGGGGAKGFGAAPGGGGGGGPLGFTTNYGAGVSFGGGGPQSRYDWNAERGIQPPGYQTAVNAGLINPAAATGQAFRSRASQQRRAY